MKAYILSHTNLKRRKPKKRRINMAKSVSTSKQATKKQPSDCHCTETKQKETKSKSSKSAKDCTDCK